MLYFRLTDEIRKLISQLPEVKERKIVLGCKSFCKLQIIASDELELLKKLLKEEKILEISIDDFNTIKASTKSAYFRNIHICEEPNKEISEEEKKRLLEEEFQELSKDRKPVYKPYLFDSKTDIEYIEKQRKEIEKSTLKGQPQSFAMRESTMSYGVNLLVSFFLVIFGTYSVCKYFFELSDETNFKFTLVISIIVMFAEAVLLLIKLEKESNKEISIKGLKKSSFAYKFNKNYRSQLENEEENKKRKVNTNKTKID